MQNYRMEIQYNGTKYDGWQKQGNTENTIQGKIENVLSQMVNYPVLVHGAGRTDAGVHAKGQVANFKLEDEVDDKYIHEYLCKYLPTYIAVLYVEKTDIHFHSRLNAKSKKYVYRIWNSIVPNVFESNFLYMYTEALDIKAMETAAAILKGEHDFKAFCTVSGKKKSTVRTIYDIKIESIGSEIRITYTGNGFLYNMIRIITGTLIEIGAGSRNPEDIYDILLSLDRKNAGPLAPACGLTLEEVYY